MRQCSFFSTALPVCSLLSLGEQALTGERRCHIGILIWWLEILSSWPWTFSALCLLSVDKCLLESSVHFKRGGGFLQESPSHLGCWVITGVWVADPVSCCTAASPWLPWLCRGLTWYTAIRSPLLLLLNSNHRDQDQCQGAHLSPLRASWFQLLAQLSPFLGVM